MRQACPSVRAHRQDARREVRCASRLREEHQRQRPGLRHLVEVRQELHLVYLDSGWPGDNYEVTLAMATALIQRDWSLGTDLFQFSFPLEGHSEKAWGRRLHLPTQYFAGGLRDYNVAKHGYRVDQGVPQPS